MDEQALLPGGVLGLSAAAKPLQPTDSQVRGGGEEPHKESFTSWTRVAQSGCVCAPDGQGVVLAGLLHVKRKDRFAAAHHVGQTAVIVPDVRAAVVPNGISLCGNQCAVLLTFCEAAQCNDA